MSTLKLNGATNGSSILKAPDTGSTGQTFTMPASTGTLLTTTGSAANLTAIPAANITGTLPAISGINLTALNATNLGSGTVPTARLGSGSASSSVFLSGANTWIAAGGGKMLQTPLFTQTNTAVTIATTTMTDIGLSIAITPSATSSKILVWWLVHSTMGSQDGLSARLLRDSTTVWTGHTNNIDIKNNAGALYDSIYRHPYMYLDSPNTTSAVTYKVQVGAESGDSVEISSYDGYSSLLVMEIGA